MNSHINTCGPAVFNINLGVLNPRFEPAHASL